MRGNAFRFAIALATAGLAVLVACSSSETSGRSQKEVGKVRKPAVAGTFYPGQPTELRQTLEGFLRNVAPAQTSGKVIGIVCPHAGYAYSGQVAAYSYAAVKNNTYDVVCLVGPSHRINVDGAAVYSSGSFETPLGSVDVDEETARALVSSGFGFIDDSEPHFAEHSIEVQLPFLQTVLRNFRIVPILTGDLPVSRCDELGKALANCVKGKKVLFVASSDLSHYPAYEDANRVDSETIRSWESMDLQGVASKEEEILQKRIRNLACTMCGSSAIMIVMAASKALGADSADILKYTNSGDVSGDKSGVVGYAAAAFVENSGKTEFSLTGGEKKKLLSIARSSIAASLGGEPLPEFSVTEPKLKIPCGAFVTLRREGSLRGCIGRFVADRPLYEVVSRMAVAAATEDSRFRPVSLPELSKIDIEISVLSPLKKMSDVKELELGKHGIYIVKGARSGCYLPQVADETGWSKDEFLNHCCAEKAGLEPDAWKRDADVFLFTAVVFAETK
ncbi:MAG: AmmeMemoRadiSam system protein B [Candidatus Eisenbacteria bacterium]|nr:AmmeMemoRadiSam system protein B [Candidatus Eisenbacteria bacterium]